jgi:sulfur-oxidizing protein SoxX
MNRARGDGIDDEAGRAACLTIEAYNRRRPPATTFRARPLAVRCGMEEQRSSQGARCPTDDSRVAAGKRLVHCALLLVGTMIASGGVSATDPSNTAAPGSLLALHVVADGVPEALAVAPGDAGRGRALIVARDVANCTLCHAISDAANRFAGNLGPPLDGIGRKLSVAQLRLRVADNLRLNASTIMPSYYRIDGLDRVAAEYRGKPILTEQEIEDIIAYLATLK